MQINSFGRGLVLLLCTIVFSARAQINESEFELVPLVTESAHISNILDIIQDEEGYIWIGTDQGLLKLHGTHNTLYQNHPDDSTSLPFNEVTSLHVDGDNVMWIGTEHGLYQYDHDCDCFQAPLLASDQSLPDGKVIDIASGETGTIWVAFESKGLYKYYLEKKQVRQYLNDPNEEVNILSDIISSILVESERRVWIGTGKGFNGNGLILLDPATKASRRFTQNPSASRSLVDDRIGALIQDDHGRVIIGSYQCGLHFYNPSTESIEVVTSKTGLHAPFSKELVPAYGFAHNDPNVQLLFQDSKGGYWIGTTGVGLYYFATDTSASVKFLHNKKEISWASNNTFNCIYEDRQGTLWVGCEGGDLYKKDIYAPILHYYPDMYNSELVYQSPFQEAEIWAGSEGGGLRRFNFSTNKLTVYQPGGPGSIRHNSVRNVYQENPDILWVGVGSIGGETGGEDGQGGLDKLDLRTGKFAHFDISRSATRNSFSHTVYNILEDDIGRLWLSTGFGGIYRSNQAKDTFMRVEVETEQLVIDQLVVYHSGFMPDGKLWFDAILPGGGTLLLLFDQSREQFSTLPIEEIGDVTNLVQGLNGELWLSTWATGILKYNPKTGDVRRFTVDDGLPSIFSTYLIQGENNDLWIGTRYGACHLDLVTEAITPIDLHENWFYFGASRIKDGRIFFMTKNRGLVAFYPDQIAGNPFPSQTRISQIFVSGQEHPWISNQALTLNYMSNDIRIEFDALHFANPPENRFAYKLAPVNTDWIDIGNEQKVWFQNLSPGSYKFHVRSASEYGVWGEDNTNIEFTILSPPWKTGWAFALYTLLITGIVYSIYRFSLRQKLAQQEAKRLIELDAFKDKFYTNITHEFRTPLTVIEGMADEIGRHPDRNPQRNISLIKKNSRTLLALVNQLLEMSKLNAGKVNISLQQYDVIAYLKHLIDMYESFARHHSIGLQFYSEESGLVMDTDIDLLGKAVTNILSNAVKFTPEHGNVLVVVKHEISEGQSALHLLIKDTGVGIAPDELPKIFDRYYRASETGRESPGTGIGLALTHEIVHLLGGTIDVESTLGKGSTFHITLPKRNEAPVAAQQLYYNDTVINHEEITHKEQSKPELPIVLIIEDNTDVIEYLVMCLQNQYNILTAPDGKKGLQAAFDSQPDIIVSDVMMPGMDGYEVCAAVKQDPRTDHIPVILLTARIAMEDRLQGLKQGADAYLAKPFEREELLIQLENLLESRARLQQKYSSSLANNLPSASPEEEPIHAFIQRVERIVLDNLDNDSFDYDSLASTMNLSRSQLNRKIKSLTGKSTSIYVRSIRLHKAKELLRTTDMNVTEVSYAVGFNSPVYFSQAFKETFGASPSACAE